MKKTLLILWSLSSPLFAGDFTSFHELTEYLATGKDISVVVHDNLCQMIDTNTPKIPSSTMVMQPNSIVFTEHLLGFDGVKFSAANYYPAFPNGILQRASFGMNDRGQASITIAFFDAETNKKSPEVKDVKILCQLGEGVIFYKK